MSTRPMIGIHVTLTDRSVPLEMMAHAIEERGLDAIYLSEHTHIPINYDRRSYPEAGGMPEKYKRVYDPYIALSFIAARTGLEVGTCVALVANHDAVALAKTIATLDHLSGGRFFLGVGFGWSKEEFASHNDVAPAERVEVVRETVELMQAVWTTDVAAYDGRYRRLPPSWSWPKPVRAPHPPTLLGAHPTDTNLRRAARWADGWITMGTFPLDDEFPGVLARLRAHWRAADRAPEELEVLGIVAPGDVARLRAAVEQCQEEGVRRIAIHVGELAGPELLRVLDDAGEICASAPPDPRITARWLDRNP